MSATKVVPQPMNVPTPSGSSLLRGLKSCKQTKGLLNCIGITCMPFCCTGIACMSVAAQIAPIADALSDVVHFYGGEKNLQRIANLIHHELDIFMRAVNSVNTTVDARIINVNMTLLDVIITHVTKTGSIIEQSQSSTGRTLAMFKNIHPAYKQSVWDIYNSMGGNYKVIVYGLLEYLSQMYDPTSNAVMSVVYNFNQNGPLRNEVAIHKC